MGKIGWLMIAILVAGCSGTPGEGTIERQLAQQLYQHGGDHIYRMDHFEKLSGHFKDDGTYVAEVAYDLIFKKSYAEAAEETKARSSANPLTALGVGMGLFTLKLQYGDFKAGEVIHREQRLALVKTDQGWMLENG